MIPSRLAAPAATWELEVDVVVLGSGAAGLAAALAVRPVRSVLIVTKDVLNAGSTAWAQGGLAGVLDPTDSLENHVRDTLAAGAGLCDEDVVRALVREAPTAIRYLMRLGAAFDPDGDRPALTREGGHSHNRIVHSGGDRSGAEVQRTLDQSAMAAGVQVMEQAFALDLVTGPDRAGTERVAGVTVARLGLDGRAVDVGTITARAVVLATAGYGQIFASTSNPPAVTGDGVAMAMRAGLAVRDVEFVQFHPTVMWRGPDARGQQALISEAVRGEGAILYDGAGRRVMAGAHPQEDLAPRDVVAAAISARMAEAPGGVDDHVLLDATHMGERFYERFPSITAACREAGIDPARDRIPVAPAADYACGGVPARLDGTTALRGLFAVGEVSCTGVHGANRLASNSLTESVVAGTRLGRDLAWELPEQVEPEARRRGPGEVVATARRPDIRAAMSRHVGVRRDAASLAAATTTLAAVTAASVAAAADRAAWETTNLVTVASAVVAAAAARTESRGCHRRTDFPDRRDEWVMHLDVSLGDAGAAVVRTAVPVADARPGIVGAVFTYHPLSDDTRRRLLDGGLDPDAVAAVVRMAVAEDLMGGIDVTSAATVPAGQRSVGTFGSRGDGVVAGLALAAAAIDAVCGEAASELEYLVGDGDRVQPGQAVARVTAPTRLLLTAERTALNLLCHLSGVATLTRRWADALAGTGCVVRDTRKTTPGLRALEKYAVRCGGGANHRMGLADAALVKDNHVLAAGGVAAAFAAVRELEASIPVEIEVDSLDGLREAILAGADAVLLDNFEVAEMRQAVALRADLAAPGVVLEASGGLTLEVASQVGRTGVDFVAVGELTHSAKVLDLGLDLVDVS